VPLKDLHWKDAFAVLLLESSRLTDEHIDDRSCGLLGLRQSIMVLHVRHIQDLSGGALVCLDRRERKSIIVCRWILYHFAEVLERAATQ
jgi:hypothetical protein